MEQHHVHVMLHNRSVRVNSEESLFKAALETGAHINAS